MALLTTALGIALLLNNLHAVVAVVLAVRWRDARIGTLARRCEYATLGLAAGFVAIVAIGFFTEPWPAEMSQADRQRRLSNFIAEGLYDLAFLFLTSLLPTIVAWWLGRRLRKVDPGSSR